MSEGEDPHREAARLQAHAAFAQAAQWCELAARILREADPPAEGYRQAAHRLGLDLDTIDGATVRSVMTHALDGVRRRSESVRHLEMRTRLREQQARRPRRPRGMHA
jgi:hypothetical protein